ncbi:MAG: hypothetical protein IJT83_08080 [Victivallales bacterium]|nr:hypothetical protein [Victivallales bacterium]
MGKWHFLPTFQEAVRGVEAEAVGERDFFASLPTSARRLLAEGTPLTEAQRKELHWRPASFPHRDFVRLMPENKVHGWYGCLFDVPPELAGRDLLLDLGIIDDADETYLNGSRIGGTGTVPGGSAWQSDRLYRISAERVKSQRNYLAVHVWSLWGLGGIVGPPVMTVALASADAKWELAFAQNAKADSLNSAKTLAEALAPLSSASPLEYTSAPLPWKGYASWPEEAHFAVFKLSFDLKTEDGAPICFSRPVVMDVGAVFDVAAFYLNGVRVGRTGRFPEKDEPAFTEAAQRARFIVEKAHWSKDGRNELVAVVYRERGVGGLPGIPGILLENPTEVDGDASFAQVSEAFDVCLQSDWMSNAAEILKKAKPQSDGERVWLLSRKAHLAYLEWRDGNRCKAELLDDVLAPVAEILSKHPTEAPRQSAMQAFCRILRMAEGDKKTMKLVQRHFPRFGTICKVLPPDRKTQGDWPMAYGNRQYILAALGKIADWRDSQLPTIPFNLKTGDATDPARYWQPANARFTDAPNALVMPASQVPLLWRDCRNAKAFVDTGRLFPQQKIRRAGWWDDHGEMHPFDDEGPNLHISSESTIDAGSTLSLYLGDFDWRNTLHPRQQSVIVFDEDGSLVNALWSGKSDLGVYERLAFISRCKPRLAVLKHRSACVAVSGLFIDIPAMISGPLSGKDLQNASEAVKAAWATAVDAERRQAIHSSLEQYLSFIKEIKDVDELIALLDAFAGKPGVHPLWQYAAIGRLGSIREQAFAPEQDMLVRRMSEKMMFGFPIPLLDVLVNATQKHNGK